MRISDWSSDVCSSDLVLTVTPAPLTVAANDLNRIYDGTALAGNGVSYSGFVGGQDASVLGGSLIYGGSAQGAVDAGSYTIEVSGLSSGNYAITYIDGALTTVRRGVTVTADALSRLYGEIGRVSCRESGGQ